VTKQEIHQILQTAFDQIHEITKENLSDISTDTVMAIGYAVGCVSKAKALIGRDIDDEKNRMAGSC
jgi:hypothetical protein